MSLGILQARILEWVALPSSRGSSQPRDWTQAFCIAGIFFTIRATREAQEYWSWSPGYWSSLPLTQESNQVFLHCRQILYQLSYQGSQIIARQCIKRQRHHFADKSTYSQGNGLSSSHVWMWELKYKKRQSTKELMLSNCDVGEDSWESLGQQGDQTSQS